MENLIVKDILQSQIAVATDAGDKVYHRLISAFDKGWKVTLDFKDISVLTTAFLNAAIGQLYSQGRYNSDFLNESLKLINISEEDKPLFLMVVKRAKEYFADKKKFDAHTSEIFNKN